MATETSPAVTAALEDWAFRVRAEREQVERLREDAGREDFYAPMARMFRADPHRTNDPTLEILKTLIVPGESWLDIGAGGGRYTLPVALSAGQVTAVEPSAGMREVLAQAMTEEGISNIDIVSSTWPMPDAPQADVAFASHVGYDIEEIGPFIEGMEASARRLCVMVLMNQQPTVVSIGPLWEEIHGEPKHFLPALFQFLELQLARGVLCEVRLCQRDETGHRDVEAAAQHVRPRLWLNEGSEKDKRFLERLPDFLEEQNGLLKLKGGDPAIGIVSWVPPRTTGR